MFYETRHRLRRITNRTRLLNALIPGRAERQLARILAGITRDPTERAAYLRRCSPWWSHAQTRAAVLASTVSSIVSVVIVRVVG
jgi:hypothetical protein